MDLDELQQLIASLEASGLRSLELHRPGVHVKLTVSSGNAAQIATTDEGFETVASSAIPKEDPNGVTVSAESAGVFVGTHPMRKDPLVAVGSVVKKDDVLGLLKIGPIYAPIIAPFDGVVAQILVGDGALLGFGAPVMEIRRSEAH